LKVRYPNATQSECKRFFVRVKNNEEEAAQRIESWLQWRADCGLKMTIQSIRSYDVPYDCREYNRDFIKQGPEIWNEAAKLAMELESKGS
jgi:hypothetical protein